MGISGYNHNPMVGKNKIPVFNNDDSILDIFSHCPEALFTPLKGCFLGLKFCEISQNNEGVTGIFMLNIRDPG